ncbi:ClpP/crotonase-like domain-containing protein [Crepidotus variabilis]|uniref:ClpP/crotonase-like domain-containing protein n=1 Tax=Crepidotus variabilis TaxID=179855 RepID=A0A9P6EIA1_9AGAR|nr:ClpP/crotonase-like domain-containing protein [Crepidotus variabilis]
MSGLPSVHIVDGIATIALNRPSSLNALTPEDYDVFASALREIDKREDVVVTVWQGKWFCAGTDVKRRPDPAHYGDTSNLRNTLRGQVVGTTLDCGKALYSHRKILVAALNGPAMGIAASFLGYFDFIYAMPNAWISLPFSFLGIIAEGGSSVSFVNRMGLPMANEVLLWGKKKTAEELLPSGFINKVFHVPDVDTFHAAVRSLILSELLGLDKTALLITKSLIRKGLEDKNDMDAVNLRESYAQAERFASGIPTERFDKIARKEIKHKL